MIPQPFAEDTGPVERYDAEAMVKAISAVRTTLRKYKNHYAGSPKDALIRIDQLVAENLNIEPIMNLKGE